MFWAVKHEREHLSLQQEAFERHLKLKRDAFSEEYGLTGRRAFFWLGVMKRVDSGLVWGHLRFKVREVEPGDAVRSGPKNLSGSSGHPSSVSSSAIHYLLRRRPRTSSDT